MAFFRCPLDPRIFKAASARRGNEPLHVAKEGNKEYVNKTHFSEKGDELGKDEVEDKTNAYRDSLL